MPDKTFINIGPLSPEEKAGLIHLTSAVGLRYPSELIRLLGRNWTDRDLQEDVKRLIKRELRKRGDE